MTLIKTGLFILLGLLVGSVQAIELIRAGTLKFGTVNWELDVVRHHKLDRAQGIALEIIPFSNSQATKIAFQSKQADLIVGDWLWVSRERHNGEDFSFIPYSGALGAIMVPPGSKAQQLADLRGQRVGIAGGAYDKSWLLLRAWAQKHYNFDPLSMFDTQYAAPPLLNGQIEHGNLDAVLNFWHYCARLEAQGYRRLVEMQDIVKEFTQNTTLPMVGYIFRTTWARNGAIEKFNAAVRKARQILLTSDAEWERLRPLMQAKDEAGFRTLRNRYRAGVPQRWGDSERIGATQLFNVLASLAGKTMVGMHKNLADGTFWDGVRF